MTQSNIEKLINSKNLSEKVFGTVVLYLRNCSLPCTKTYDHINRMTDKEFKALRKDLRDRDIRTAPDAEDYATELYYNEV